MLGVLSALVRLKSILGEETGLNYRAAEKHCRRDRRIARLSSVGIEARWRAGLHAVA
jgi:hypothetical protein